MDGKESGDDLTAPFVRGGLVCKLQEPVGCGGVVLLECLRDCQLLHEGFSAMKTVKF